MKISSRLDYALSCAVVLADMYQENRPVSVAFVAGRECIEYDYAEQLLRALKRGRVVKSLRGAKGGYLLLRPPSEISATDIMVAIEKSSLQLVCERKKSRRKRCIHFNDCRVKTMWLGLRENIEKYLSGYTLKKLLDIRKKEKSYRNEH